MTSDIAFNQAISDGRNNVLHKKFSQNSYLCDYLKVLHEFSTPSRQKIELLVLLEENIISCPECNIAEVISSLKACLENTKDVIFMCQLLSTITTLVIYFDILAEDIGKSFIEVLLKQVKSGIDSSESSYVKSCCCQCLCQIEDNKSGILWSERDYIFQAFRQEKSFLHQDYALLVTKIITNGVSSLNPTEENGENHLQRQQSMLMEPQELRQVISLVMENPELYTTGGLWHVVTAVKEIAQNTHHVSPTIFKPFMLSHMSTMNPVILHLIIFILVEFEKEILTDKEESQIISCLVRGLDHPSLVPAHRLFFAHWLKILLQDSERDYGIKKYQLDFYPRVFDPVDCQLSKLLLLNLCVPCLSELHSDMNGALLLASVGYLHKLVWHTGSQRAVVVLFRVLFQMYQRHSSRSFSQDINRFIKGLISGFPHFIPHALDFLECLKESSSDSGMYLEILKLLHSQVISTSSEELAKDYQYFLQVMKKVSLQKEIPPKPTVMFLNHLVQNASRIDRSSWVLGNGILAVCHNLLVCHGAQQLYTDIGDILFSLMMRYDDMDIQDRALFYYSLLTSASSNKIQEFLKKTTGTQNYNQTLSSLIPEEKSRLKSCINIIDSEPGVLKWHRKSITASVHCEEKVFKDLKTYFEWLSTTNIQMKAVHQIKMSTTNKEKIQAVSINFTKDNNFENIKAVDIAQISSKDELEVCFYMQPKFTVPSVFNAWVEFTENKLTYRNDLSAVQVSLLDMMLPLPGEEQLSLFDQLWQCFSDRNNEHRTQCVKSIKIVHKPWEEFITFMNQHCKQYLISQALISDENTTKYGMLSASGHHLLLTCLAQGQQINVSIATDSYHMLPFVDKFLTEI